MKPYLNFCIKYAVVLWASILLQPAVAQQVAIEVTHASGRAYFNHDSHEPFEVNCGRYSTINHSRILTMQNGLVFMQLNPEIDLRMKENTVLAIDSSDLLHLRKGVAGVSAQTSMIISTPHAHVSLNDATVVIKVNPVLSRICVIKGNAIVTQDRNPQSLQLTTEEEVAVAGNEMSSVYLRTDELRYAWYWVEPDKEPSMIRQD